LQRCNAAVHLCTGNQGTDEAIRAWLERHGVEVVACADAFEACTVALTQPDRKPDLALIGTDWLAPEELAIIGYWRETWPGLTVILYGSAEGTAGLPTQPSTHVCRSAEELQHLLEDSPDNVLKQTHEALRAQPVAGDDWQPRPDAPAPATHGPDRQKGKSLSGPVAETKDAKQARAKRTPRAAASKPGPGPKEPGATPTDILTDKEWAALLEDEET
jgi:hypothetical protein